MNDDLGFVDVDIDADIHAAAVAESDRTSVPVRLVLLRWILLGMHADAVWLEQRLHGDAVAVDEARNAATSKTATKINIEARRAARRREDETL